MREGMGRRICQCFVSMFIWWTLLFIWLTWLLIQSTTHFEYGQLLALFIWSTELFIWSTFDFLRQVRLDFLNHHFLNYHNEFHKCSALKLTPWKMAACSEDRQHISSACAIAMEALDWSYQTLRVTVFKIYSSKSGMQHLEYLYPIVSSGDDCNRGDFQLSTQWWESKQKRCNSLS